MRILIGWILAVVGVLGSGATGLVVVQTVTDADRVAGLILTAMFAVATLGSLGGAWLLLPWAWHTTSADPGLGTRTRRGMAAAAGVGGAS